MNLSKPSQRSSAAATAEAVRENDAVEHLVLLSLLSVALIMSAGAAWLHVT